MNLQSCEQVITDPLDELVRACADGRTHGGRFWPADASWQVHPARELVESLLDAATDLLPGDCWTQRAAAVRAYLDDDGSHPAAGPIWLTRGSGGLPPAARGP